MNKQDVAKGRRKFVKRSLTGLAGAVVFPSVLRGAEKRGANKAVKNKEFIHRILGKTGLKLPIVSMGVMNADNPALVRAALDAGIVYIDTAHYYSRGRNERMIGEVIKDFSRDSYIISTKARASTVDRESAPKKSEIKTESAESFIKKVEISLKRLGLEYVDILYLHSAKKREDVFNETILKTMQKLKKDGKIRFIGISTHGNEHNVIDAAVETKVYEVILTSYNFRMRNLLEVEKSITEAVKAGLGVVAMKTQAGVYWDKERKNPINMKAALKWALQNKNVHTAIPGFTTFDQIKMDISVMDDLTLTQKEKIDLKLDKTTAFTGLYCQQCEKCLCQCGYDIEIPILMRSYMYNYGYKNAALAKETLHALDLSNLPCTYCNTCKVKCTMDFDVKNKILDIARIKNVPGEFLV